MDRRMEGYIFQYSPLLKDEVETTLHTLLPLLQHYNPTAAVESNFHGATLFKRRFMEWNENKQMIVDTMAPYESDYIQEDENLQGFLFDMNQITAEVIAERPTITQFDPHKDDNTVSTLKTND